MKNQTRTLVDQVNKCSKSFRPLFFRDRCMRQESQPNFNNMSMLPLHKAHLLMSIRAREAVVYSRSTEKRFQSLKFTTTISLELFDFRVKLTFNITLEGKKN